MAERQGFMMYHEDLNMLLSADDMTIAKFLRQLADFSMNFDETGEIPIDIPFSGMTRGLFISMRSKIIRDKRKYDDVVKESTIKGLISAIQREHKTSTGKKLTPEHARMIAEQRYAAANSGQQQSTVVDTSQLTVAKRSVAEDVPKTDSVAVAEAKAKAVFSPPSQEEVIDHLQKSKWVREDEAETCASGFIKYETEHNWLYGDQPVRDWKALLWQVVNHPNIWKNG